MSAEKCPLSRDIFGSRDPAEGTFWGQEVGTKTGHIELIPICRVPDTPRRSGAREHERWLGFWLGLFLKIVARQGPKARVRPEGRLCTARCVRRSRWAECGQPRGQPVGNAQRCPSGCPSGCPHAPAGTVHGQGTASAITSSRPSQAQAGSAGICPELVQVVGPRLHHRRALLDVARAVVSPPQRIPYAVRKLHFYDLDSVP